jgi:uncharacterized protein (DUF3820 family)
LPILVSLSLPAHAVSQAGAIVDLFSPSARGAGMAHVGALVPEGPFALRWNPAGVALNQPAAVGFTYNEVAKGLADDIWIYHLGGTVQWGPLGFGAMYSRFDKGEQLASGTRSFDSHEDALRLGAGVDVFDLFEPDLGDYDIDLGLGVSAKRFGAKLAPADVTQDLGTGGGGGEASAWTADVGAMLRFGKYLWPAIVDTPQPYVGVRASVVYDCLVDNELEFVDADQSDPLPERLRYGFAFEAQLFPHHALGNLLELVLAYERLESKVDGDFTQETHIGLEVAVANTLVLRGGSWDDPLGRIVGGTYGVGLRWARPDRKWNLQLDYANRPQAFGLDRIDLFSATVGYALFD